MGHKSHKHTIKPHVWRRSPAGKYLRHIPRLKQVKGSWLHRRLGDRFIHSDLWEPHREALAKGFAIGCFFAMLPIPFQMVPAGLFAVFARGNIPLALLACWITNPLTTPLFVFLQLELGEFILQSPSSLNVFKEEGLLKALAHAPVPFLTGSVVMGCVFAVVGFFATRKTYDWVIRLIHRAHEERQNKKATPNP